MNGICRTHRAVCECVCVCGCDCMGGFSYKNSAFFTYAVRLRFWKCHKTWFIVCLLSALFELDNLNHSHFPYPPAPPPTDSFFFFFPLPSPVMDYWNIKISGRRGPWSGIKMSGLYLQPSAARQGQGLQLFVYIQSGATWKVMSPNGCLLLNTRR